MKNGMGGKRMGRVGGLGNRYGQGNQNGGQKNSELLKEPGLELESCCSILFFAPQTPSYLLGGLKFSAFSMNAQMLLPLPHLTATCSVELASPGTLQRADELPTRLARQNDSISLPSLHSKPSTGGMSSL